MIVEQVFPKTNYYLVAAKTIALPLHCTASGKAHLSRMPAARMDEFLSSMLEIFTENTITSKGELLKQIRSKSHIKVFQDDEEFSVGVCGLSIALNGGKGSNFALGISMPKHRFNENEARSTVALTQIKTRIEKAVGFR